MMLEIARRLLVPVLLALASACSDSEAPSAGEHPEEAPSPRESSVLEEETAPLLLRATEPFTGDWDAIRGRKVLRVLVSHNRTSFFVAKGRVRGFEYEMFHEFEKYLATHGEKGSPPVRVAFVPLPFDELLPALLAGRGDVAAAALTITPERASRVAFTDPYLSGVDEILVAHRSAPPVERWEDLAGRRVHVVAGTSYVEHLEAINRGLAERGLAPIVVETSGRGLTTEDMLELVSSGAFSYTVADGYLAELWSGVLKGLRLVPELKADRGGRLAWAVRPGNPELKKTLDAFVAENRKGTLIGNVLFNRYHGKTDWIENPLLDKENSKLTPFVAAIKKYSEEYGFDWRVIAAQAYQESGLDPDAVSGSGAVGLMQLLPSTAKDMGFENLRDPDENLHAGVKYMDWLRRNFFDEPQLRPEVVLDFALAAYNAGPGRVRRWREEAPKRRLDPDRWFGNVEILALEDVGLQPVRYVGNVNKYFIVLSHLLADVAARETELRSKDTEKPR